MFKRKSRNEGSREVERISFDMMCTEEDVPDKSLAITDEEVEKAVSTVADVEQTDRGGRTLLINAAFYGRTGAAKKLIKRGANVNAKDKAKFTPLHAAAQEGHTRIVELLLKNGADVNARDKFGNPPIMRADESHKQILKLLLQYGADPYEENDYGVSAMKSFEAYPDIVNLLRGDTDE